MSAHNNPDWLEFKEHIKEEIEKRAEVKIAVKRSIVFILIFCIITALPIFVYTSIKTIKILNTIERKLQTMDSVNHKKELCIYCRQ